MKRIFTYMATMLVAAGCTMDHKAEYDPDMQIQFLPVMHLASKSYEIIDDYPDGKPFSVNAWTLERDCNWNEDVAKTEKYLSNAPVCFNQMDGWVLECGTMWPPRDRRLTVIAYSPAEAFHSCSCEKGVSCTYDILESQIDLLYTKPQADMDKVENHGIIVLPFKHALTQVDFKVKNRVAKDEEIIIRSLKLDNVSHKGTFESLPEPKWTLEEATATITFFEGEQTTRNVAEEIGRSWYIIPQVLSTNVTIEYEYRTSEDTGFITTQKTCELNTNLKAGRHYTYTVSVGIDDVKFLLEIIEDRFKEDEEIL